VHVPHARGWRASSDHRALTCDLAVLPGHVA
jgi:hypothetical protein